MELSADTPPIIEYTVQSAGGRVHPLEVGLAGENFARVKCRLRAGAGLSY